MRHVLLSCLVPALVIAADPAATPNQGADSLDLTGLDRTRPLTALGAGIATTLISNQDEVFGATLRGSYAPSRTIGVAVEVPVAQYRKLDHGPNYDAALGDVTVSGTIAGEVSKAFRIAAGLDLTLDTASDSDIGNNATLITPVVAGAFELDPLTRLTGSVRYTRDLDHANNVPDVSDLEFRAGGIRMLSKEAFATAEGRLGNDFENSRVKFSVYGGLGTEIERHHVGRIGLIIPFDRYSSDATGWMLTLDYAYAF